MKTSIIILTRNQFHHTVMCLDSIRKYTSEPCEIIVVDNGSTDLTKRYMNIQSDVKFIGNEMNVGFAAGCNQGLAIATGDHILFLNNDTVVTPNWLTPMLTALSSSPDVGMVGPLTNFASGHQVIPVPYTDLLDLNSFAHEHGNRHEGKTTEVRRLIGFCMLVKRSVLEEIGGFDEHYGLGNIEDDDLCLRAARAGYRMLIANSSFIHHVGHATIKDMEKQEGQVQHLIAINRQKALQKWGSDIFELIYKEDIRLTCVVLSDTEEAIKRTIDSISDIAEEIIVVDPHGTGTAFFSHTTVKYIDGSNIKGKLDLWKLAIQQATGPYIMLLEAGESISDRGRRQLRALKRSLPPNTKAVSMQCEHHGISDNKYQVRLFHHTFPFSKDEELDSNNQEVIESMIDIEYNEYSHCL